MKPKQANYTPEEIDKLVNWKDWAGSKREAARKFADESGRTFQGVWAAIKYHSSKKAPNKGSVEKSTSKFRNHYTPEQIEQLVNWEEIADSPNKAAEIFAEEMGRSFSGTLTALRYHSKKRGRKQIKKKSNKRKIVYYTPEEENRLLNWSDWADNKSQAAKLFVKENPGRAIASVEQKIYTLTRKALKKRKKGQKVSEGYEPVRRNTQDTQSVVARVIGDVSLEQTKILIGSAQIIIPSRKIKVSGIEIQWGYD